MLSAMEKGHVVGNLHGVNAKVMCSQSDPYLPRETTAFQVVDFTTVCTAVDKPRNSW